MIRILIVDDHTIVREGLKQIFTDVSDIVVSGEARNGEEVLANIASHQVDLVVLDITLPGKSGLSVLKEIKEQWPNLPVLILSMHPEEQYAVRALKAGAGGYLTKESAPNELAMAIRQLAQGKKYITPSLAENLVNKLNEDNSGPLHDRLSNREYEVLRLLASGNSIKHIAQALFLSPKTISTYKYRIMEKMDMKSVSELTRYAVKAGLVD